MKQTLFILYTLFTLSSFSVKDGSIHDFISKNSDGSIFFSQRYYVQNTSTDDVSDFISYWYECHLSRIDLKGKSAYINSENGVFLFKVFEDFDPTIITGNSNADLTITSSRAYYDLNFVIYNGKLKLIVDNMYTKIIGETLDSQNFTQVFTLEDTYTDITQFETLIAEKCREVRKAEILELKRDVKRLIKSMKKAAKTKKKKANKLQLMQQKLESKKKMIIQLEDEIQFEKIVRKDVESKVDYAKLFQVEKWNLISKNFENYISSCNYFSINK